MSHATGRFASIPSLMSAIAAGFMLSACVVAVNADHDDDWEYDTARSYNTNLNVRLNSGKRAKLRCPRGYETFVEKGEDGADRYGCVALETKDDQ